jgi:hypothetical protein
MKYRIASIWMGRAGGATPRGRRRTFPARTVTGFTAPWAVLWVHSRAMGREMCAMAIAAERARAPSRIQAGSTIQASACYTSSARLVVRLCKEFRGRTRSVSLIPHRRTGTRAHSPVRRSTATEPEREKQLVCIFGWVERDMSVPRQIVLAASVPACRLLQYNRQSSCAALLAVL